MDEKGTVMSEALVVCDTPITTRRKTPYEHAMLVLVGKRLRAARKAKRWTLRDMEAVLRARGDLILTYSTIGHIEMGRPGTSFATLCYLAEFLEIAPGLLALDDATITDDDIALLQALHGKPAALKRLLCQFVKDWDRLHAGPDVPLPA